jgi:hypothetical protein
MRCRKRPPCATASLEPILGKEGQYKVLDTGIGASYTVTYEWVKKYVTTVVFQQPTRISK